MGFSRELLSKNLFSVQDKDCLFKVVILSNARLERYIILQRTLVVKLRKQSYLHNHWIAAEKQMYYPVKET